MWPKRGNFSAARASKPAEPKLALHAALLPRIATRKPGSLAMQRFISSLLLAAVILSASAAAALAQADAQQAYQQAKAA